MKLRIACSYAPPRNYFAPDGRPATATAAASRSLATPCNTYFSESALLARSMPLGHYTMGVAAATTDDSSNACDRSRSNAGVLVIGCPYAPSDSARTASNIRKFLLDGDGGGPGLGLADGVAVQIMTGST